MWQTACQYLDAAPRKLLPSLSLPKKLLRHEICRSLSMYRAPEFLPASLLFAQTAPNCCPRGHAPSPPWKPVNLPLPVGKLRLPGPSSSQLVRFSQVALETSRLTSPEFPVSEESSRRFSKDELPSYRLLILSNHSKTLSPLPEKDEAIVFSVAPDPNGTVRSCT